jgi:hypothetical protein
MWFVMTEAPRRSRRAKEGWAEEKDARIARTVRFPDTLRDQIARDAERCSRSFEAQALAVLRRHYGEDVELAPASDVILAFALGSLAGIAEADRERLLRRAGHRTK